MANQRLTSRKPFALLTLGSCRLTGPQTLTGGGPSLVQTVELSLGYLFTCFIENDTTALEADDSITDLQCLFGVMQR